MLTRAFTVIAVISGLAVIGVAQFMVRPHVTQIIEERNTNKDNWTRETARASKLQREKRETEEKLVATETTLKDTQNKLEVETSRANTQETLANKLQRDLNDTRTRLTTAEQQLAAWDALGFTVDQIRGLISSVKDLQQINEVLEAEKQILTRVNKDLEATLKKVIGDNEIDPPLPEGTKGTVVVVDPKWKFVVLDLGDKDRMVPNGVLMVSRDGKLVAKVRIMTVYQDRSIANVMPGWDFGEILEGDVVLY